MNKSDFYFDLPDKLIAQTPLDRRDSSRLLCMPRKSVSKDSTSVPVEHMLFRDLPSFLYSGDCLVLNDSRVLPARLIGTRDSGGAVEVLLLKETSQESVIVGMSTPVWECLVRPGKKVKQGTKLTFGNGELTATVNHVLSNGNRIVEFRCDGIFLEVLDRLGKMPLPPYIHKELQDAERYQTVFSREVGSAAAPTAGLHFTDELLNLLKEKGVEICYITLHVGLGTFRPVKTENIKDHEMHSEHFTIPIETADIINKTKNNGGRIIAVGTTSCRTLESVADGRGHISPVSGSTNIFIYPGYKFKCIDGLITNFHLPESTLIMLVSAFAGRERVLDAYKTAIAEGYRFFSFGDAMMII